MALTFLLVPLMRSRDLWPLSDALRCPGRYQLKGPQSLLMSSVLLLRIFWKGWSNSCCVATWSLRRKWMLAVAQGCTLILFWNVFLGIMMCSCMMCYYQTYNIQT